MPKAPITHRRAFSLVELSIVLVILGLLTGGILAGQSLIRAAELRSVNADVMRYRSAIYSFRDKYFALPGDMANATRFWGTLAGTGSDATCQDTAATGLPTCNGGGDGRVTTSVVTHDERFRSWQHLANAGLVEGSYTGKTAGASGTYTMLVGSNVPSSKLRNSFFDISYEVPDGTVNNFAASKLNTNSINIYGSGSNYLSDIKPEEAWSIDTKMDDGNPVYGSVVSTLSVGTHPGCTTATDATAQYNIQASANRCVMRFVMN